MRILMWFTIGFTASCAVAIYLFSGSILAWLALAFGILAILALLIKPKPIKIVGITLLGFAVGIFWMWGYDAIYLSPARQYDGKTIMAEIEVTDYCRNTAYGGIIDGKLELDEKSYRVRMYLDEPRDVKPGDVACGVYALGMTTPNGEEESDYYQGKGIFLIAEAEGALSVESAKNIPMKYYPAVIRRTITDLLDKLFPEDVLGFARALLLGDSSLLSYEVDTAFKVSGIRHTIAVSGLHISILFSMVYTVACKRKVLTALLGIPILVLFAAIAGFTPSVNRACVMQVLMILALILDRDYDPPTALAFAVIVMLAANPMTITSVSFQLSVGCVVGIFLFSGRVSGYVFRKLGRPTGKSWNARFARWASAGVGVSLSSMTMVTPLMALYFGTVSLVSVFTNLLTLWAISIIFYGIMAACVMGGIWLPLGKIVAWLLSWLVRLVLLIAKLLATIPFAAVYTNSVYIVLWIAVCYLLFAVFLLLKKRSPVLLLTSMAVCLGVSLAASYIEPRLDNVRITVFDVGEGQSILLQNQGEYYLIDCGSSYADEAADTVAQELLSQGVMKLDGLILTNYDTDNAGGVDGLLFRVKTEKLYLPDISDDGDIKAQLVNSYADKIVWVREDMVLTSEESTMTMIPAPSDSNNQKESSLCILFQAKNYDILITGDRGITGERALMDSFELPRLDLLVAGHHGSSDSTNFELLSKTMPVSVVISSGDIYGNPSEEVLQRMEMFGCKVWRTDQSGTIVFRG